MPRSCRSWIGLTIFLLGLAALPLAASGRFSATQESAQAAQEDRPALQSCGHHIARTEERGIIIGSPNAGNLNCDGGGNGCGK